MPIRCRARMIDGTPVTFELKDHGRVPLDGLRDCYLTTMIGEGLFIRSEFRPLGNATNRFEFDRATLERHGIDTSTVERWESWGAGEGVWESMFEPRYRTSDSAGGTISYAFNHDETGQAMTDRKNLEEAIADANAVLSRGAAHALSNPLRSVHVDTLAALVTAAEAHLASPPKSMWAVLVSYADGDRVFEEKNNIEAGQRAVSLLADRSVRRVAILSPIVRKEDGPAR